MVKFEEAILMKDFMALRGQDRLKNDVRVLIDRKILRTVMVEQDEA